MLHLPSSKLKFLLLVRLKLFSCLCEFGIDFVILIMFSIQNQILLFSFKCIYEMTSMYCKLPVWQPELMKSLACKIDSIYLVSNLQNLVNSMAE